MIKFVIGFACYGAVGAILATLGATWHNWQLWAVLVAMTVNEINERYWARKKAVDECVEAVVDVVAKAVKGK